MKFIANFSKYIAIEVEAKSYEEAENIADFILEQKPEKCEEAPWFLHTVRKVDCKKIEESVYIES